MGDTSGRLIDHMMINMSRGQREVMLKTTPWNQEYERSPSMFMLKGIYICVKIFIYNEY